MSQDPNERLERPNHRELQPQPVDYAAIGIAAALGTGYSSYEHTERPAHTRDWFHLARGFNYLIQRGFPMEDEQWFASELRGLVRPSDGPHAIALRNIATTLALYRRAHQEKLAARALFRNAFESKLFIDLITDESIRSLEEEGGVESAKLWPAREEDILLALNDVKSRHRNLQALRDGTLEIGSIFVHTLSTGKKLRLKPIAEEELATETLQTLLAVSDSAILAYRFGDAVYRGIKSIGTRTLFVSETSAIMQPLISREYPYGVPAYSTVETGYPNNIALVWEKGQQELILLFGERIISSQLGLEPKNNHFSPKALEHRYSTFLPYAPQYLLETAFTKGLTEEQAKTVKADPYQFAPARK